MSVFPRGGKIIRTVWLFTAIWSAIVYILSSLSSFIPPADFSLISLFALGFPYILAAHLVFSAVTFFVERRLAWLMLLVLPVGYFNFVTMFALHAETKWEAAKDPATLRVLTWNVQSFANYLHKKQAAYRGTVADMLDVIHDYDPDVLCLQEYKNIEHSKKRVPAKRELDSMGYHYYYCSNDLVATAFDNPSVKIVMGVAIFSKIPFIDSGRININNGSRNENFIYTDLLFDGQPVRIFTAHLQSFEIYSDTSSVKKENDNIYDITYKRRKAAQFKIRETEVRHQQEVSVIRKAIDTTRRAVIYCGDLNTTPASYNYRLLKGGDLEDAFLAKGSGIGNTFYKICPTLRIDVCLADTSISVLQCIRIRKKLSDHYPVVADLRWKH